MRDAICVEWEWSAYIPAGFTAFSPQSAEGAATLGDPQPVVVCRGRRGVVVSWGRTGKGR